MVTSGGLSAIGSRRVAAPELSLIAEQLWPGLDGPDLRVLARPSGDPAWQIVERHGIASLRGSARMLLPLRRRAAARCLVSYASLRPLRRNLIRRASAVLLLLGLPGMRDQIVLEARRGSPAAEVETVAGAIRKHRGAPELEFAMPVRRTANRKALLQVIDARGAIVGFAKLGWNEASSSGVQVECEALRRLDGGGDGLRAPRVLLDAQANGFPYLLTEPLPHDLRRVGAESREPPSGSEFAAIAPFVRRAAPSETEHVRGFRKRLSALRGVLEMFGGAEALQALLEQLESDHEPMPVAAQWHGDFAFWNVARAPDGTLWCWDFEDAHSDAPMGLDVLHWHASRRRVLVGAIGIADRDALWQASRDDFEFFGMDEMQWRRVHLVYAVELTIRSLEKVRSDGWASVWATQEELELIMRSAGIDTSADARSHVSEGEV